MGVNRRNYTEDDVEELYKWIDNYPLTRPKKNISRDFSDAIPLVEILKHQYPRLVESHNYVARNSVSQKLINWQTLNRRVLNKLNVNVPQALLEHVAQAVPGSIERVLFDVKERIEKDTKPVQVDEAGGGESGLASTTEGLSAAISGAVIPIKQKDGKKAVDHKIVPLDEYLKMQAEVEEKNEAISILNNKVQHLESLMAIKDERIVDLTKQLQVVSGECGTFKDSKFLSNLF